MTEHFQLTQIWWQIGEPLSIILVWIAFWWNIQSWLLRIRNTVYVNECPSVDCDLIHHKSPAKEHSLTLLWRR